MIDRDHALPVSRQAKVLRLSRSTVYYRPRPVSAEDLALMRRVDELHLDYPFAGARMLRLLLRREGVSVGCRHVATLMKRMGLRRFTVARRQANRSPDTRSTLPSARRFDLPAQSCLGDGHQLHPNAARVRVSGGGRRRGQSPRACTSHIDHDGGDVLRRGNGEALARYGEPEIFNTDQGSQFTSLEFTSVLNRAGVAISMDGKGAWRDNVLVERLWRTIKYEEVYLKAYDSVPEARASIARYLTFYNSGRPHSSLDGRTPDEAYFASQSMADAA
jgi:putative transposase